MHTQNLKNLGYEFHIYQKTMKWTFNTFCIFKWGNPEHPSKPNSHPCTRPPSWGAQALANRESKRKISKLRLTIRNTNRWQVVHILRMVQADIAWSGAEWESVCWGVLGIPFLGKSKVSEFPFHVFDRYDTHIQDFEDILTGIFAIVRCPSSKCKLSKFRIFKISEF